MAIMRWDPFNEFLGLSRELDRMFAGTPTARSTAVGTRPLVAPRMDVFKRGEDLVIRAEMPGMSADDIDISVEEGILTISAERSTAHEVKEEDYLVREVSRGLVRRSMPLPEGVDPSALKAEYTEGVLEIVAPHAAAIEARTFKVPIGTGATELAEESAPGATPVETPVHATAPSSEETQARTHH